MKYQPHIDGLRAIAVILVIFFHLEFSLFSGGFIGVDVFYVISGFLITSIIKNDIEAGRFSLRKFYFRRAKRLLPAVFFTIFMCFVVAGFLFTPFHFQSLSNAAISAILAVSNILFWYESDYFDIAARVKPLLHTWSLSVEWQFYVIWPSLVFLLFKIRNRRYLPLIIIAIGCLSLLTTLSFQDGEVTVPGFGKWIELKFDGPVTTFYHFPFRIFEFSIGALLIWVPRPNPDKLLSTTLLAVGIGLIVAAAIVFNNQTLFPSYNALLPATGTALAILAGQSRYLGAILQNRFSVYLGQISYSVYLVHWPLIVFSEYFLFRKLTLTESLLIGVTSLIFGGLMYRFIELPFHKGKVLERLPQWGRYVLAPVVALIIIMPARNAAINDGWTWRIDADSSAQVLDAVTFHKKQYGGAGFEVNKVIKLGNLKKPAFLIAGDSHSLHYAFGMSTLLNSTSSAALGLFDHGCFIAPGVTRYINSIEDKSCGDEYPKLVAALDGNNLPLLISYFWTGYQNILGPKGSKPTIIDDKEKYADLLLSELDKIRSDIGIDHKLVIIGQVPGAGPTGSPVDCMLRPVTGKYLCQSKFSFSVENSEGLWINKRLKQYADKNDLLFFDPQTVFCRDGICQSIIDGKVMYSDARHLSKDGSLLATEKILSLLKANGLVK